jgi:hypothetical protein
MIDRRPALVAGCTGAADVMAAVRFACEHDALVSIKGMGTTSVARLSAPD